MVREGKNCRERGVQQIGREQVKRHRPERPLRTTRKGANYRPPKEEPGAKETGVLHFVPTGRAEREIERRRHVPDTERHRHDKPAIQRISKLVPNLSESRPG